MKKSQFSHLFEQLESLKKEDNAANQGPSNNAVKIEFKHRKEKKIKTHMFNFEKFVTDPKELDKHIRNLKKTLGTACTWKETTDEGNFYSFNGDVVVMSPKIKAYLIDNKIVDKNNFK